MAKNEALRISGLEITRNQLKYSHNGWSCGYGKHRNKKAYTRKQKHREKFF